jgi:Protein of unknown function (DUF4012)
MLRDREERGPAGRDAEAEGPDVARPPGPRAARRARRGLPAGIVCAFATLAAVVGLFLWLHLISGPVRLATGLSDASDHLEKANDNLVKGEAGKARAEVLAGSAATVRAREALEGRAPLLDVLDVAPKVGPALEEVPHLVAAAEHSSRAARRTFDIVDGALEGPNSIIARGGGGKIRVERIVELADEVDAIRSDIDAATKELTDIEPSNLPRRMQRSVDKAIRKAGEADEALVDAEAAFEVLPSILGADGKRSYLLGFQNSAEARGTGGAVLQYAILKVANGDITLKTPKTIYNVDEDRQQLTIPLPEDAWYQATIPDARRFGNANWSPDFPLSTELLIGYAHASDPNLPEIDGAIGVAPEAMKELMPATGKVKLQGTKYGSDNIVKFVLNEQYARYPFPKKRRKRLQVLVDRFYQDLFDPKKPFKLLAGMSDALAGKHMQIWMNDEKEQKFIERMNWDGAIEKKEKQDYLYLVEQNVGGNKLDYFDTHENKVDIAIDGEDAVTSTSIQVANRVPLPQPSWVLGDAGGTAIHRPMVVVYTRPDTELVSAAVDGVRTDSPEPAVWVGGVPQSFAERGKKAWPVAMAAAPGETATANFEYRSPGVVRTVDGRKVYRLIVQHQPKVRPEWLSLGLRLPEGARGVKVTGWKTDGEKLTWEGPLTRDLELEVSWRD